MADSRAEAFTAFRDALNQHFIPEGTLVKAFNTAFIAGLSASGRLAPEKKS